MEGPATIISTMEIHGLPVPSQNAANILRTLAKKNPNETIRKGKTHILIIDLLIIFFITIPFYRHGHLQKFNNFFSHFI